jgi:hypothetical protein
VLQGTPLLLIGAKIEYYVRPTEAIIFLRRQIPIKDRERIPFAASAVPSISEGSLFPFENVIKIFTILRQGNNHIG